MKTIRRLFVIIAFVLIIGGICLVTIYGIKTGFKFKEELVTNTHENLASYESMDLDIEIADVEFINSDSFKVVCVETEKLTHEVKVENNTLKINYKDDLKWYEKIFGFRYQDTKVEIYLPYGEYNNLKIKAATGDITIPAEYSFNKIDMTVSTGDAKIKASAKEMSFNSSTGDITLENSKYENLTVVGTTGTVNLNKIEVENNLKIETSTGEIKLNDVKAKGLKAETSTGDILVYETVIDGDMNLITSTGDVTFRASDAKSIKVETSTGDVTGSLLTGKAFTTKTSTGDINVPSNSGTDTCDIRTSTGDIEITIK